MALFLQGQGADDEKEEAKIRELEREFHKETPCAMKKKKKHVRHHSVAPPPKDGISRKDIESIDKALRELSTGSETHGEAKLPPARRTRSQVKAKARFLPPPPKRSQAKQSAAAAEIARKRHVNDLLARAKFVLGEDGESQDDKFAKIVKNTPGSAVAEGMRSAARFSDYEDVVPPRRVRMQTGARQVTSISTDQEQSPSLSDVPDLSIYFR